jgi:hypothetical protein
VRFLRGREKRQLDFQTAVRRRMLASVNDVQSHPTQAAKESPDPAANTPLFDAPADPDVAGLDPKDPPRSPAVGADAPRLRQLLGEEMRRRQLQVLSVRSVRGGFSVSIMDGTQPNERWYSASDIRRFQR